MKRKAMRPQDRDLRVAGGPCAAVQLKLPSFTPVTHSAFHCIKAGISGKVVMETVQLNYISSHTQCAPLLLAPLVKMRKKGYKK